MEMERLFAALAKENVILQGLLGGLIITLLNALGALAVLAWRRPSERFLDGALGFAAGVMLTASFTSLIIPGVERGGLFRVLTGLALGVLLLDLADHLVPHLHPVGGREGRQTARVKAVWLFILAITLHNLPEGLAVAAAALGAGMGAYFYASLVGIRAGLVEIPLAVVGAWAVGFARPLLPYAMGFAAGAMLYVISDEIVPETHRKGHERLATLGTLLGVAVMLYLDVALG